MSSNHIVIPPLDAPFAAWLQRQPMLAAKVQADLQMARLSLAGRSSPSFRDGRDAAQRIRSLAEQAGFPQTATFYYQLYEWFCLRMVILS